MAKYQQYDEYKDSGVEWLGEIPNSWQTGSLRWMIDIASGESLPSNCEKEYSKENQFPVVGGNGVMGFSNKVNTADAAIAVGRVGALCGNIHSIDYDSWITDNALKISKWNKFSKDFLVYLLKTAHLNDLASKTAQPLITGEQVKSLKVVLLPIAEQKKIANFLDHETGQIDSLIEKQQTLIQLLKEKRQAVISHAVTKGLNPDAPMKDSGVEWLGEVPEHWEFIKFDYVINAVGDIDHYMPKSIDSGIPYVMTGDLRALVSEIDFDNCKQVAYSDYVKLSRKIKASKDDIIFARYATIGTLSYVDIDADFLVSYSCVTIKPNAERTSGRYLFRYLKSQAFLQAITMYINSNTQGNVGIDSLRNVKVIMPPLSEQEEIINFLNDEVMKIDRLLDKSKSAITLMQERRTALISAAVTGKIDVRGWRAVGVEA